MTAEIKEKRSVVDERDDDLRTAQWPLRESRRVETCPKNRPAGSGSACKGPEKKIFR